jgi:isoaspartyl peptidase/L-asparaginase-like protein (Ntn-hydrolase superfamily)
MYSIIVHGGVGAVPHDKEKAVVAGIREAALAGSDVLASGGPSLDAVGAAINVLEDNPLFNSGTGSVLTFDGEVEMDAAVAYGPALGFGTIAVDDKGEVTAGTSTGGVFLKLLGRVGDTPLPGAGTYATKFGGTSSTGPGESMMRTLISKTACNFMRTGLDAQGAASGAVNMLSNMLETEAGIIVVDNHGGVGFAQNTPQMAHAWFKQAMTEPVAGL